MKSFVLIVCALAVLTACEKVASIQNLGADGQKVIDQATPVVNDAIRIATPVVSKGIAIAKDAYPSVEKALEDSSNAIKNTDLSTTNLKSIASGVTTEAAVSSANAGLDSNGNLHYDMSHK